MLYAILIADTVAWSLVLRTLFALNDPPTFMSLSSKKLGDINDKFRA